MNSQNVGFGFLIPQSTHAATRIAANARDENGRRICSAPALISSSQKSTYADNLFSLYPENSQAGSSLSSRPRCALCSKGRVQSVVVGPRWFQSDASLRRLNFHAPTRRSHGCQGRSAVTHPGNGPTPYYLDQLSVSATVPERAAIA